jgi:hypothetical protein
LLEVSSGSNTEQDEVPHKSSFQAYLNYSFHQNTWAYRKHRPFLPLDDADNTPIYLLEAYYNENSE